LRFSPFSRKLKSGQNKERLCRFVLGGKFMDKKHIDENEDVDKYGEFVCSYFAWLQPSSQKEKAKELSNMTKKKEDKR
jgi:hypothetical protein